MSHVVEKATDLELHQLYDDLARWMWSRRGAAAPGTRLTLRKRLLGGSISSAGRGEPDPSLPPFDLDAWILAHQAWSTEARLLDIGCGFGGTLITLAKTRPAHYLGISASAFQVERACEQVAATQARHCQFEVREFSDLPSGPFQMVLAIESLGHATNLRTVFGALSTCLAPEARVLIIDDFAAHERTRATTAAHRLEAAWSGRRLLTESELIAALPTELRLQRTFDLSPLVPITSPFSRRLRRTLVGAAATLRPSLRLVTRAFLGGIDLESLYARGHAKYLALELRRE